MHLKFNRQATWQKFNFFTEKEINNIGDQYFDIVPCEVYQDKLVLDVGCGTGRWTKYVSLKAGFVEAIDPSNAVFSAAHLLASNVNTRISRTSVDNIPFPDSSFDFVFSLGVLHHIPNTEAAMKKCVEKLKQGGYFLVYLYYSLDNRGPFFKLLFRLSNITRKAISKLPPGIKKGVCDVIAFLVYLPFVLLTRLCIAIGLKQLASKIPLSWYANKSLNVIRNDALDRFGTPLERRFSKKQIREMMVWCGLENIIFSEKEPYWHAIGRKK
jgi:SAM-dependent methyltransferase